MAEERVWQASYNLDGVAQLWYTQLEDSGTPTWARFKEFLNLRFGPPLRSAPLFELTECRRTGTVEEYSNRFQALLPRAGRLDEESVFSSAPAVCCRRLAMPFASTTPTRSPRP